MTRHRKQPRPSGDVPPAGEATNAGQVCTCQHLDVLHNLTTGGRRTGCSVSTGPTADHCGCRSFTPLTQESS